MLFNSLEYFFFLGIVFGLYWSFRNKIQVQNLLLLLASYVFYSLWDYRFLSLIIISSVTDYLIGNYLSETTDDKKRRNLLILSLTVNLGILFVFKYFNFFIDSFLTLSETIGLKANISTLSIILPVGISFYTFQTLSYTIDIYNKKISATKNALSFFTFVSFFPQLVAGPIERASNLLPQFYRKRKIDAYNISQGLRQIIWGLSKKVLIADNCATLVDNIFEKYDTMGSSILWLGMILFAFQIYCDFSGYSDIAIGSARLFGIELKQNFATPYLSKGFQEFWKRWHISLSTWFRDYVFIPLGGSRVSSGRKTINIYITFLVSGLWHGANWTFVFWGFLHATLYALEALFKKSKLNFISSIGKTGDFIKMLFVFLLICFTWLFFRSETIGDGFSYLYRMFFVHDIDLSRMLKKIKIEASSLYFIFIAIGIMILVETINRHKTHGLQRISNSFFIRYLVYIILSLLILEFLAQDQPFIYFQF